MIIAACMIIKNTVNIWVWSNMRPRVDPWTVIKTADGVVSEISKVEEPLPQGFPGMQGYLAASFRGRLSNVLLGTTFLVKS